MLLDTFTMRPHIHPDGRRPFDRILAGARADGADDGCVVDHDVDGSKVGERSLDDLIDLVRIAEVGRH
jgi:hypothetical protein